MIAKRQGSTGLLSLALLLQKGAGNASARSMVRSSFEGKQPHPEGIWKPQKLNVKAREEGWCGLVLIGYVVRHQCAVAVLRNVWK
jgi:hypothetical protein